MHVGFDHHAQFLDLSRLDLGEHVFKAVARRDVLLVARHVAAVFGNFARALFRFHHHEIVARDRSSVQPDHLDRNTGAARYDVMAFVVYQRADASGFLAGDENLPDL